MLEAPASNHFLSRIQLEYNEGQDFLRDKKLRWVRQLVLMNNLQRGDQTIASTQLFSFFNRVFSSIYSDVLQTKFTPSEDSDYKKVEACNKLQQNDYQEMEMWLINYDWVWDACFFGEGYLETIRFDKKKKLLVPDVINPLVMIHDPYFSDMRRWRYYGKWKTFSKHELKKLESAKVLSDDFDITKISPGLEQELWDYKNKRDSAKKGVNVSDSSTSENNIYQIYEHFTIDDDGDRCLVWTDKNFGSIIRQEKISKYILDDEPWPIAKKQIFREPHSTLAVSVPDIVEDKHRAKSVLMNLLFMAAKDDANPIYLYNPDLVQDTSQFYSRQIMAHIPVDDIEKAVKPMMTKPAMSASVNAFMSMLASESSEAIGTAVVQPTMQRGKKSATESAMLQQIADLTASLQAKVISIGERDFWSQWYQRLTNPRNMKASDSKIISLTSVTGVTFETIKVEDFKTKFPPKIFITSKKEAEYKELVLRRDLMQNYPILIKSMDTRSLANFNRYVYFPKFIADSSTIDRIVPSSIDQIKARTENELLDQNKFVPVDPQDDDEAHMYEHAMAKNTPAKWAHYFIHEKHRAVKKNLQEKSSQGAPAPQEGGGMGESPTPAQGGMGKNLQKNSPQKDKIPIEADKQNPDRAAVPLQKEETNSIAQKGRMLP